MDTTQADWIAQRDRAVWGTRGIATLAATEWLDTTPRRLAGLPGAWRRSDDVVVGDVDGTTYALRPGETAHVGDLTLLAFARDGSVAVRVFDPSAPAGRGISRIERYADDPGLRRQAVVVPASGTATTTESVDGHRSETTYDVVLELALAEKVLQLATERDDDGSLFAAFSDATSGAESYRFRFLRIPAPADDGTVEVDFNRAYLPPCAFSDHYVCVFPPAQNRWAIPIRAGERNVA